MQHTGGDASDADGGGGVAVVGFVGSGDAADAQGFAADAGRRCGLVGDGVVAEVCAAVGAGEQDGLGGADILVVGGIAGVAEVAGGGDGDVVAGYHAAGLQHTGGNASHADGGGGVAVVGFVGSRDAADAQGFLCEAD